MSTNQFSNFYHLILNFENIEILSTQLILHLLGHLVVIIKGH